MDKILILSFRINKSHLKCYGSVKSHWIYKPFRKRAQLIRKPVYSFFSS